MSIEGERYIGATIERGWLDADRLGVEWDRERKRVAAQPHWQVEEVRELPRRAPKGWARP